VEQDVALAMLRGLYGADPLGEVVAQTAIELLSAVAGLPDSGLHEAEVAGVAPVSFAQILSNALPLAAESLLILLAATLPVEPGDGCLGLKSLRPPFAAVAC